MTTRTGRPKGPSSAREKLIHAARQCFTQYGYSKVSTRQIAQEAGVDAAMIRYYFRSKSGLFDAMIRDTFAPILEKLTASPIAEDLAPLELMQTYYRMIASIPTFPRLIQQVLNYEESPEAFRVLSGIFEEIFQRSQKWIHTFQQQNRIKSNLTPDWIRLSFLSLMIFPVVAPKHIQKKLGVDLNEHWLMDLAEHNNLILEQGIFLSQSASAFDQDPHSS